MTLMRSPEGDEVDIPDAGVKALEHLGWELSKPKTTAAKRKPKDADAGSDDHRR